ncbi:hypothetical protein SVAN01_07420 [Stagonosporopsis vannaccii]|nr:hypothetical protein SVAN01_07420 [Stagonosporopsis vannaccii]
MPRDNRLFTLLLSLAVCLHTVRLHICMLWLTMVLQKPAIARRAIAIELLRRSDQMDSHRRRAQSIPTPRLCFEHSTAGSLQPTRTLSKTYWPTAATTDGCCPTFEQAASGEAGTDLLAMSNGRNDAFRTQRLDPDSNNDRIDAFRTQRLEPAILHAPGNVLRTVSSGPAQDLDASQLQVENKKRRLPVVTSVELTPPVSPTWQVRRPYAHFSDAAQDALKPEGSPNTVVRERQSIIEIFHKPSLSDIESASSSDTSLERKPRLKSTEVDIQGDATGGAQEDYLDSPNRALMTTTRVLTGTGESRTQKRWSTYSMESVSSTVKKTLPTTLRARSKTNGGLLEFKAKTAGPKEPLPTRKHRRILSLNIPIRPSLSQSRAVPHTPAQSSVFVASTPQLNDDEASAGAQMDAELQYKQRHIFVGTASLHTFIDTLEISSSVTTTKTAVMKAFTQLASQEQLMARRSSLNPKDWNLVTRIPADTLDFDYITLARVQLGSVSLQQFVDSIPFNMFEEAPLMTVVEAFKIASHLDAMESRDTNSKASAFRNLLLSQSNPLD